MYLPGKNLRVVKFQPLPPLSLEIEITAMVLRQPMALTIREPAPAGIGQRPCSFHATPAAVLFGLMNPLASFLVFGARGACLLRGKLSA